MGCSIYGLWMTVLFRTGNSLWRITGIYREFIEIYKRVWRYPSMSILSETDTEKSC